MEIKIGDKVRVLAILHSEIDKNGVITECSWQPGGAGNIEITCENGDIENIPIQYEWLVENVWIFKRPVYSDYSDMIEYIG